MDWATIANLILTIGIPASEKLWTLVTTNNAPTQADWDTLKALANVKAVDLMKSQLTAAGIALDSPQGLAMISAAS